MVSFDYTRGGYWLGHPGALYPIVDRTDELPVADVDEPLLSTSLGGGVRSRERRNRPGREWRVQISDARVDEIAHVEHLLAATLGPYVWVDPYAQVTNLLLPEESVGNATTPPLAFGGAGAMAGRPDRVVTTVRSNSAATFGSVGLVRVGSVPAPPVWSGRKVTASALLSTARSNGAYVVLYWLDGSGSQIGTGDMGNAVTGMDGLRRSTVTAAPKPGAVSCRIGIVYAERIARPQVTWTDGPVDWGIGAGAHRVTIHSMERTRGLAVPDQGGRSMAGMRRTGLAFTVREVGPAGVRS